jgi:hypothetical protein
LTSQRREWEEFCPQARWFSVMLALQWLHLPSLPSCIHFITTVHKQGNPGVLFILQMYSTCEHCSMLVYLALLVCLFGMQSLLVFILLVQVNVKNKQLNIWNHLASTRLGLFYIPMSQKFVQSLVKLSLLSDQVVNAGEQRPMLNFVNCCVLSLNITGRHFITYPQPESSIKVHNQAAGETHDILATDKKQGEFLSCTGHSLRLQPLT